MGSVFSKPKAPPPPPPPPPPVTVEDKEVQARTEEQRLKASRRRGRSFTMLGLNEESPTTLGS